LFRPAGTAVGAALFLSSPKQDYAVQIAGDWNANDAASGFAGYVLASRYQPNS
jgi:hypothetical protein